MHLRFFETYDEHGRDSGQELQIWDESTQRWEGVPYVRVSERLRDEYMEEEP